MNVYGLRFTVYGFLVVLFTVHRSPFTNPIALAQTMTPASSELPGQTISLDLKGVDILDVLKLLSQKSGLNFVAGRNVTGRVTIFARDVGVWEAFERIVEANELAYERRGELVTVMAARDYELLYGEKFQERKRSVVIPLKFAKANQLATVLNQLKSTVGQVVVDEPSNTVILADVPSRLEQMTGLVRQLDRPTVTRIYTLNYAEAEKLKEKVQELLTPGVGIFSFDARTNKVIVTDLEDVMPKIDEAIQAFDERDQEVLIEAKIVKVELTDEQNLGVDWQQVFAGIDTKARINFRTLSDIVDGAATGFALRYASAPKENTRLVIEALKKFGRVDTVSNPRITVSNNQEAKILIGTKEVFVTTTTTIPGAGGQVVSSPQVQFVDVGTKLFVTPRIKPDGHIQMKIRPEVSSVKTTITSIANTVVPVVSTTEAETNVLVKSGATLIIGGLIDTKVERNQSQVPVLGDIPVLGAAFRSRADTTKKTELVVFLTPQIITASGEAVTVFPLAQPVAEPPEAAAMPVEGVGPADYPAMIRQLLEQRLSQQFRAMALEPGSVEIAFVLGPNGRLIGQPQIRSDSPQGKALVQAAQAVIGSMRFPPFPSGLEATETRFRLTIYYAS